MKMSVRILIVAAILSTGSSALVAPVYAQDSGVQCDVMSGSDWKPEDGVPPLDLREAIAEAIVEHAWKRENGADFNDDLGIPTEKSLLVVVKQMMDAKNDADSDDRMPGLRTKLNGAKDKRAWWLKKKGQQGVLVVFDPYGDDCGTTYPSDENGYKDEKVFKLS